MKLYKKQLSTAIAIALTLTIAATLIALPIANAHTPAWDIKTNAYVTAAPNPIGVGEYTTLVCWVDENPPTATGHTGQFWEGYKLDITKPDGSKQTIGPWTERSATGSDWQTFVPDQVGTYTIVFSWPGATATNGTGDPKPAGIPFVGDYFEGSTSAPLKLVVQQEPIASWPEPPLPTGYWTRPIDAMNRGWSTLASNWLKGSWLFPSNFQRWGTAPESPHIVWSQPIVNTYPGGIADAMWPGQPTDANDYESPWSAPIIMQGKIYYNSPPVSDWASYGYYCRDLYTGDLIWYKNGTDNGLNNPYTIGSGYNLAQSYVGLTQGWLYHYDSVNGQGVLAYLIMVQGTTWYILDSNGNLRLTLKNVPSAPIGGNVAAAVTDQDGSLLYFNYNKTNGNILAWNISQSIPHLAPYGTSEEQWKARFGATIDAVNDTSWWDVGIGPGAGVVDLNDIRPRSGYSMNVTIQAGLPVSGSNIQVLVDANRVPKMMFGCWIENMGMATCGAEYTGTTSSGAGDHFSAWAVRFDEHAAPYTPYPNKLAEQNNNLGWGATLLWNRNYTVPIPGQNYTWVLASSGSYEGLGGVSYDDQIFVLICKQLRQMWGYSLATGDLVWGPTPSMPEMNYYGITTNSYYGKILATGYGGTVWAIDGKTGKVLWTYNATSIGYESPYGQNYPLSITAVADGKVYLHSTEHSPTKPLWRGSYLRCLNITDGTELWKLEDFNQGASIADGYIVTSDQYNNQIYCIGKGPSAVTVSAPQSGISMGNSFTITGTVTDGSPGAVAYAKKYALNGVACVSDESMEAWMEYLYMQQAMPTSTTGVPVTIDVIDPNNNYVNLGTATNDLSDFYNFAVNTNDLAAGPGTYKVIATFAGSNSYGPSYAESAFTVNAAPAATSPAQYPVPPDYTMAIVGAAIAIIIVVVIVGILILRKK
jgi:hypothetical protein